MKKLLILISSSLLIVVAGFFIWKYNHNFDSQCGYNSKMSMVCEFSCAAKEVDKSKIVAQSKAQIGDCTKCPISGVVFLVSQESKQITYNGKTAFTCCETCAQIFNEFPEKYAANIN